MSKMSCEFQRSNAEAVHCPYATSTALRPSYIIINCSFQNKKLKKTKEKETHNVSKNTTCQMHTNYAQLKRKIT